jgi:hypothetical protein
LKLGAKHIDLLERLTCPELQLGEKMDTLQWALALITPSIHSEIFLNQIFIIASYSIKLFFL